MVRYLDFNDGYIGLEPGHPSDNIPACLAVAEAEGRTGRDLVTAVALGYEVQVQLQDAANLYRRGWDHVNYVLVSATLAAGKLTGLDAGQLTQAVNIAMNGHTWAGRSWARTRRSGAPPLARPPSTAFRTQWPACSSTGELTVSSYDPDALADPAVAALMARVEVRGDPVLTAMLPARIPNRVTIRLTSGDELVREVLDAPGGHGTPMTDEQFEEKFTALVAPLTSAERCGRLLDEIWNVDRAPTVTALTGALVVVDDHPTLDGPSRETS
ncbi:MmgE/PrpD family protein [Lentzea atacamensis]|uniref:MmgE/PrpD family protein n=2 Tax=Lentzea atacamensis TaxID=531938 RepID=A0ABX9EB42_9PSEU|nr:MmgE/PrpD family protein [Lentzea atacamensis]